MSGARLVSFASLAVVLLLGTPSTRGQPPTPNVVKVYEDIPAEGEPDTRDDTEKVFQPFSVFPKAAVERVSLTDRYGVRKLDTTGSGTCCEFSFRLGGADWFGGVKFIPGGQDPGEKAGLDVNGRLRLGEDKQAKVVLRFRARSADETKPKVVFQAGGTSGRLYADGHKFPKVLQPSPTELTAAWKEYSVDLSGNPAALRSVVCPLCLIVKSEDNPRAEVVTVYVDDVRFEVIESPPAKKP
ncbi:MAG TPA: hypothetical protein VD866_25650 [Urbifossiella sp.]|nr:hypothetical protein [Urbifossiella sp.]